MNEFEKAVLSRKKELEQEHLQQAKDLQVAAGKIEELYKILHPAMKKYNIPVTWTPGHGALSIKVGRDDENFCYVQYIQSFGKWSQVYHLHCSVKGFSCSYDELWGDMDHILHVLGKMVADVRSFEKW